MKENLKLYVIRAADICIDPGLLTRGYRVLIPEKFRIDLLKELYNSHMSSSKMKLLAKQYFWWPNLDKEIEMFVKSYDACNKSACNPNESELIKFDKTKTV